MIEIKPPTARPSHAPAVVTRIASYSLESRKLPVRKFLIASSIPGTSTKLRNRRGRQPFRGRSPALQNLGRSAAWARRGEETDEAGDEVPCNRARGGDGDVRSGCREQRRWPHRRAPQARRLQRPGGCRPATRLQGPRL